MKRVEGRIAVVTGGTRGIGRAISLRLAEEGANVVVVSRGTDHSIEELLHKARKFKVEAIHLRADVSSSEQVKKVFEDVIERFARVDILVNNAAIADYVYKSGWELSEEKWDEMYSINLKGVFLCCREAIPIMIKNRWGRIINISSTSGITGGTSGVHYAATKGGVIALTKAFANEVARFGITVNCVAPSKVGTEMFYNTIKSQGLTEKDVVKKIPVGRLGRPEDIADAVAYFAGEQAGYTTGQVLVVSGGY